MSMEDRIGPAFIIDLDPLSCVTFTKDWDLLAGFLRDEDYRMISSDLGEFLHIRPKAQNANHSVKVNGQRVNPMGFYLRKTYTQELIRTYGERGLLS